MSSGYTTLGNGGSDIRAENGTATWATVSDERYKKDIVDSTAGLSHLSMLYSLVPLSTRHLVNYQLHLDAYEADSTEVYKNANTNHGFIAQEVKEAIDADR